MHQPQKSKHLHLLHTISTRASGKQQQDNESRITQNASLTELLLGAQNVEAGLGDDLTEQFNEHVRVRLLQAALVVHLEGGALVDVIRLLVLVVAA